MIFFSSVDVNFIWCHNECIFMITWFDWRFAAASEPDIETGSVWRWSRRSCWRETSWYRQTSRQTLAYYWTLVIDEWVTERMWYLYIWMLVLCRWSASITAAGLSETLSSESSSTPERFRPTDSSFRKTTWSTPTKVSHGSPDHRLMSLIGIKCWDVKMCCCWFIWELVNKVIETLVHFSRMKWTFKIIRNFAITSTNNQSISRLLG